MSPSYSGISGSFSDLLSGLLDVDGAGAEVVWIGFSLLRAAITVVAMVAITSGEMVEFPTLCVARAGEHCAIPRER